MKTIKPNTIQGHIIGILAEYGPLTVGEIFIEYCELFPETERTRGELAKRVSELERLGAVVSERKVVCGYSGKKCSEYSIDMDYDFLDGLELDNQIEGPSDECDDCDGSCGCHDTEENTCVDTEDVVVDKIDPPKPYNVDVIELSEEDMKILRKLRDSLPSVRPVLALIADFNNSGILDKIQSALNKL